jgi:Ran GTPase-activating protein (RanGAP) involved in mRNA processing and transport
LAAALYESESLSELDISLNDITPDGIKFLADVLPHSQLKVLNLNKNLLGDESMIMLCNNRILEKLDVSSSRVAD